MTVLLDSNSIFPLLLFSVKLNSSNQESKVIQRQEDVYVFGSFLRCVFLFPFPPICLWGCSSSVGIGSVGLTCGAHASAAPGSWNHGSEGRSAGIWLNLLHMAPERLRVVRSCRTLLQAQGDVSLSPCGGRALGSVVSGWRQLAGD